MPHILNVIRTGHTGIPHMKVIVEGMHTRGEIFVSASQVLIVNQAYPQRMSVSFEPNTLKLYHTIK
jgi:hypothetical protein